MPDPKGKTFHHKHLTDNCDCDNAEHGTNKWKITIIVNVHKYSGNSIKLYEEFFECFNAISL